MDTYDFGDRLDMERDAAAEIARPTRGDTAFEGDGEPYWFGPVLCPACGTWQPFEQTHECLYTDDAVICQTTGRVLTRAAFLAAKA